MPCTECGCKKSAERTLAEETRNLTLSETREPECACKAQASQKSCCSSNSSCCSESRPSRRGCSCCCRSCCACCRCCSRSSRDCCQDRINETKSRGCSSCGKKEEPVTQAACGCNH
ncbi:keratin-associated protein 5-4 [Anoplophora glabripennis]|uniref:keratin-associated protein 5-4 n=1 Tax=Anoplophora glabripennis TaxID=217634 RepID=UPI0008736E12|nr:keratin-associated protein 5-4 [Anoplophora glabripennis]